MGYLMDQKKKMWYVNQNNIKQLCFAWERAALLMKWSDVNIVSTRVNWSWTMQTASVDVDWKHCHDHAACKAFSSRDQIMQDFFSNGESAIENLASMRSQTRKWLDRYYQKFQEANQINQQNFQKMDNSAAWAKFVRDTGATAVVASSAVITAPAAACAALVGGAIMKGAAKYQDTGNVASAFVDATCEIVVGATGLGIAKAAGEMARSSQIVVSFFLKAPLEFCKSVVSGDSMPQATVSAVLEGMNMPWLQAGVGSLLKKVPVPVVLKTTVGKLIESEGGQLAKGTAEGVGMDQAKNLAKARVVPGTSLKMSNINCGHINLMAKDSDKKYVTEFCIKPYKSN